MTSQPSKEAENKGRRNPSFEAARFDAGDFIADRYRIVGSWGKGRLDEAYQAEDLESNVRVVLKVLERGVGKLEPSPSLEREFKRLSKLRHMNVARVFDRGTHAVGDPLTPDEVVTFVTSEIIGGETLGSFVRNGPRLENEMAIGLIEAIGDALASAHRKGVVHGDLSSASIILCRDGEQLRPVVTDFSLGVGGRHVHSFGSPAYRAPETLVGNEPTSMSDVFSLGVIIHEILSGRFPFTGGNLLALDFRQLEESPLPLSDVIKDIDPVIERVVLRCLSNRPEERYADASEVLSALEGRVLWTPKTRRNVTTLGSALALVTVMLGGSALLDRVTALEQERMTEIGANLYRPSVAVLDLGGPVAGRTETWIGTGLSELLRGELEAEPRVRVADGETIRGLAPHSRPHSGVPSSEMSRTLRSLLDVETIIAGTWSISNSDGVPTIAVDVCAINARTGETVASAFERGSPNSLPDLASRTAARLRSSIGLPSPRSRSSNQWDPDAVRPWAMGLTDLLDHRPQDAARELAEAASIQPDNPQIFDALSKAWAQVGDLGHAMDAARSAVALSPSLATEVGAGRQATLATLQGDSAEALSILTELSERFPDRDEHSYRLISLLLADGNLARAHTELRLLRSKRAFADPRMDLIEARIESQSGNFASARAFSDRAVQLAAAIKSRELEGEALLERAWALAALGHIGLADQDLRQAEDMIAHAGEATAIALIETRRASIHQRQGSIDLALASWELVRRSYEQSGQLQAMAATLGNMALLESRRGNTNAALLLLDSALETFQRLGDDSNVARSLNTMGDINLRMGRHEDANRHFVNLSNRASASGLQTWRALASIGLAHSALQTLDLNDADARIHDAEAQISALGISEATTGLDLVRAELHRLRGEFGLAREMLSGALSDVESRRSPIRLADVRLELARLSLTEGLPEAARPLTLSAAATYRSQGMVERELAAASMLLSSAVRTGDEAEMADSVFAVETLLARVTAPVVVLPARMSLVEADAGKDAALEYRIVHGEAARLGLRAIQLDAAAKLAFLTSDERWIREEASLSNETGALLHQVDNAAGSER